MSHRISVLICILLCGHSYGQFQQTPNIPGASSGNFDSTGVGRDSSRVEFASLELTETGKDPLQKISLSLDRFQFYLPVYRTQFVNSTIGNNGTAMQDWNFRPSFNQGFNWGFRTFNPYIYQLEDLRFFDAQSPYTHASYVQGGQKESFFILDHTQNIGKAWNFGLGYQRINSEGSYVRQTAAHSAIRLHVWFRPENSRYQALAGAVYNNGASQENGGITNTGDTLYSSGSETNRQLIPVNLPGARNRIFSNGVLLRQTYDLVKPTIDSSGKTDGKASLRLQHTIEHVFRRHTYDDTNPDSTYYAFIYDKNKYKTVYNFNSWENEFALLKLSNTADSSSEMSIEFKAYAKQQFVKAWTPDSVGGDSMGISSVNQSVGGFVRYKVNSAVNISGKTEFFYSGYNTGDALFAGDIQFKTRKQFLLKAGIESFRQQPDYQFNRFVSNFGNWSNNFNKINLLHIYGEFNLPGLNLHVSVNNRLLGNWVYVNQSGKPTQSTAALNVLSAYVQHHLRWRKWNLNSRIIFQQVSGADILRLPAIQVQESFFYEGRLKRTTVFRLGLDVLMSSAFNANAYQVQSGLFYLQDTNRNNGIVQADLYVSAKIRRVRIFVKLEHANSGLAGFNYDLIPFYPLPDRSLKIGFSWVFFD